MNSVSKSLQKFNYSVNTAMYDEGLIQTQNRLALNPMGYSASQHLPISS
jgi:hypothetical protein